MKPPIATALGGMLLLTAGIVLGYMSRGWLDARRSAAADNDDMRSPRGSR